MSDNKTYICVEGYSPRANKGLILEVRKGPDTLFCGEDTPIAARHWQSAQHDLSAEK